MTIENKIFHVIEVRSEYPIQLAAGPCQIEYTVQYTCRLEHPADIFIRDLRQPPVFLTPKANTVTVTASNP